MNKKKYRESIEKEVYKGEKNFFRRLILKYLNVSTNSVFLIRRFQYLSQSSSKISRIYAEVLHKKLVQKYGIHISGTTKIGMGLKLPHPTCIVIGAKVVIGDNCTIFQNTTIGSRRIGDVKRGFQPNIGENCVIFSGSSILGNVTVGKNNLIGANTLLLKSSKDNCICIGTPAIIREKEENR